MARKNFILLPLATFALVAILYFYGLKYSLFWEFSWYDVPLHFLGGLSLALLGGWFLQRFFEAKISNSKIFLATFGLAVGLGVIWEIFEYLTGQTYNAIGSYPLDTIKDLVMDCLGGLFVYYFASRSVGKKAKAENNQTI